ncbi:MAG: HAD family hydrolase [Bacteroidota bacterium]
MVFDLYNTLIEIKEPNHFFLSLYKKSKDGFGLPVSSYLRLVMTSEVEKLSGTLPSDFFDLYDEHLDDLTSELNSVVVYTEVVDVLEDLKSDFRIFLISNLASPYKQPVYAYNLDKYFERMIFSCDYGFMKPDEKLFSEVEQVIHHAPNKILMVGDSFKSDIIGARNMQWNYLMINRKLPISRDYEIGSLDEIRKHITLFE